MLEHALQPFSFECRINFSSTSQFPYLWVVAQTSSGGFQYAFLFAYTGRDFYTQSVSTLKPNRFETYKYFKGYLFYFGARNSRKYVVTFIASRVRFLFVGVFCRQTFDLYIL